jgi:predicted transcriptional regulator
MGFSEMLEELGVSSSHLTYHLESLGELVSKTEAGDYKLSTFGTAAVSTMRIVEDAPVVPSKQRWSMSFRWKPIFGALIIGIVLLASFSILQFNSMNQMSIEQTQLQAKYNQLLSFTASTDKAISFLRDVVRLDLSKYDVTLVSNTNQSLPDLGGVIEQNLRYSLVGSDSEIDVLLRFRNSMLYYYESTLMKGAPVYLDAQPFTVLDSAKWLLQNLWSYEGAHYLEDMNSTLYHIPEDTKSIQQLTDGNLKFNMSILGTNAEMQWYYSENGADFTSKCLKLTFVNQILKELDDSYFLYSIGNAQVNVDQAGAIQTARNAVKTYTFNSGSQQISYKVLDQPVSAVFDPTPREEDPLALVPHWTVTLYLDTTNQQTIFNRIAVGIWADTGKIEQPKLLSG